MEIVKVGIAGLGAIGSTVARALLKGIDGFELVCASDIAPPNDIDVPIVDFEELAKRADLVIEALPPVVVPELCGHVFTAGKRLMLISSCTILTHPELFDAKCFKHGQVIVPSGALVALDGVKAMVQMGSNLCVIASTKPPLGFSNAPYIEHNSIDLTLITEKTKIFEGDAYEAARGFPANVNVAATLSIAGIGAEKTRVEIWADPDATGNSHEIRVESAYSTLTARIENKPDPANPKTSVLAAQSIISVLRNENAPIKVL